MFVDVRSLFERNADLRIRGRPCCSPDQLLVRADRETHRVEFFRCHLPNDGSREHEARDAVEGQGSVIRLRAITIGDGRSARLSDVLLFADQCKQPPAITACDSVKRARASDLEHLDDLNERYKRTRDPLEGMHRAIRAQTSKAEEMRV